MDKILEKLDRIEKTITSSHLEKWINIRGVSDYTLSIPKIRRAITSGELRFPGNLGKLLFKKSGLINGSTIIRTILNFHLADGKKAFI